MSYLPHTTEDVVTMLNAVGASDVGELLSFIPESLRLSRELDLPSPLGEYELMQDLNRLAENNQTADQRSFLGAGAYHHFVPAIVNAITSRSEFLTAYTPYQAEASQGTLQAIFEFQTMICRLTGMDVANASVYDGGTASVDAVLMAVAKTRRRQVLVSPAVHPHTRQILATYLAGSDVEIVELSLDNGCTSDALITDKAACVLVQIPNFLGIIENGPALVEAAHKVGALAIISVGDPVSLGVLEAPGKYGADLVCGDAQGIGLPLSFGGPYVGYLACTKALMRGIPGRLVGMTVDHNGKRGYCLTLQAREQHIRREKASSNICSNQGLCALAVTVHLALLGPKGLERAALGSLNASHNLKQAVAAVPGFSLAFEAPTFNEFVLRCPAGQVQQVLDYLASQQIVGGYALGQVCDKMADCLLVCCTELTTDEDIASFAEALQAYAQKHQEEVAG